ncbi:hypothetical protein T12_11222 [Trichinella patagoniensis]|uniref:Uncharacterized protein n=1 Tax=Trichinella patagoniensis TaxID=990121 RepID=A0A0V1A5I2_9BILA|nr:hypothetical protein T12_11222 [Trichinella patagoniensis]
MIDTVDIALALQYNLRLYGQTARSYGSPKQKRNFVWSNFSIIDKIFFRVFVFTGDTVAADVYDLLELVENGSCEVLKAVCYVELENDRFRSLTAGDWKPCQMLREMHRNYGSGMDQNE